MCARACTCARVCVCACARLFVSVHLCMRAGKNERAQHGVMYITASSQAYRQTHLAEACMLQKLTRLYAARSSYAKRAGSCHSSSVSCAGSSEAHESPHLCRSLSPLILPCMAVLQVAAPGRHISLS